MKKDDKLQALILRQKAEELLNASGPLSVSITHQTINQSEAEKLKLIQELEVHQVELEMQNEELRLAISAAQNAIELYDFAPTGYITLSKEGQIIGLNLSGAKMLGKERSHLINSHFGFFISDCTKPVFNLFLETVFTSKAKEICEATLSTNGNLPMYVHLEGIVKKNSEQCLVTMVDITERKMTEVMLQELIEKNPMSIQIVNQDGFTVKVNPAHTLLFGSVPPSDFSIFADLQNKQPALEKLFLLAKSGEVVHLPDLYYNVNDSLPGLSNVPVWIRAIIFPLNISSGKPEKFAIMHENITERKLMEEVLRESEENFRSIFENNSTAIALIEPDSTISMVNEEFCKVTGFMKQEVIGTSWKQQIPFEDIEQLKEYNRRRLINPNDAPGKYEFAVYNKNGEKHHVLTSVSMLSNRKTIMSFVDITDRKRAEAELKLKNEELAKLNAEKDKFFSIIAHDLRSPFQSLLGFTRMMVEDLPTLTLDEIQKISRSMRNSANKLFNLLENLLEWSLMQRGISSFRPESFILLNGITAVIDLVSEAADKKMISIRWDVPDDLRVMADVRMFESILRNLVFNAVKFTPKGGSISIAATPIPGNSVEISIMDTGIGMSTKMIGNLFRLDEQTNRKGTEDEPSTGLGLIICKDFIEKHNGKLWVESEDGKGSIFYFTLPANE